MKRLILFIWLCPMVLIARAQWTAKDSLNLQRILNGQEDIKLNMDAVKQIDFNSLPGAPKMSKEKPGLKLDETLPQVLDRKKIVLTLRPYTANTKYNWDPIYQKKIQVDADTWRGDPFVEFYETVPSNWAKNVYDKGIRSSYEEIRSRGLRHNLFGERANGRMVTTQSMVHTSAMKLGKSGVTVSGGTIGGLDLMTIFTKDFWDKKGRERRARTLEVLKAYGDSTTVLLPEPIIH